MPVYLVATKADHDPIVQGSLDRAQHEQPLQPSCFVLAVPSLSNAFGAHLTPLLVLHQRVIH